MSQIIINTGNVANDGTGDPLRTAFNDVNTNFTQLFSAGPANSNITIANNTIQVTNTNGNLRLATNGIGVIVPATNMVPDITNIRYIGTSTNRFNTVFSQYLDANSATLSGSLYVGGDLNVVGGTITNYYSNANISNLVLTLAAGSSNAALANGAGIKVASANANLVYNYSANSWNSTIAITAPTFIGDGSQLTNVNATINANDLVGNTLSSSVTNSSLTSFGFITNMSVAGNIDLGGILYSEELQSDLLFSNYLYGDGSNLTNITGNAIVGNVPFALNANSAYTANLAALATQAINADTALFAINANLAAFANVATSAQTANTASYSVQSDNANSAVVAGMAYQIAPTANISVVGNITTSGYFIGNGSQLTGVIATPDTGNIGFTGDTIYDLNGINLQNSDSTHGPTAAIIIPANGDTDAILLNNIYGNVILQSGANGAPTATWLFNNDGNLTLPADGGSGADAVTIYFAGVGYTTANNVPTNALTGTGSGMTVDIIASNSITNVVINQAGTGYAVGDSIQVAQPSSTGNGRLIVASITPVTVPSINYANGQPYGGSTIGPNISVTGNIIADGNISANTFYIGNTPFTRTLLVGTATTPVTVPLASNNSFNVLTADGSSNVVVYTT